VPPSDTLDGGARQGKNDFGRTGYGGPCPPRGGPHRYFFKVYALDADLVLGPGATKADLVRKMSGSILAQGELMGRYTRR
jgi:Raf kinase inhibitor-like YbhB/YbcL family protein